MSDKRKQLLHVSILLLASVFLLWQMLCLPLSRHVRELRQRLSQVDSRRVSLNRTLKSTKNKLDNLPSKARLESVLSKRRRSWSELGSAYGVHLNKALHQGRRSKAGMIWSIWQIRLVGGYDSLVSFVRRIAASKQGQIAQSWQLAPSRQQKGLALSIKVWEPGELSDDND